MTFGIGFGKLPNMPEIIEGLANTNRKIRYRELEISPIYTFCLDRLKSKNHTLQWTQIRQARATNGLLTVQDKLDLILTSILK